MYVFVYLVESICCNIFFLVQFSYSQFFELQGVMLLVGEKVGGKEELTITIMFDRSLFTEHEASVWWRLNKMRFVPIVSDC